MYTYIIGILYYQMSLFDRQTNCVKVSSENNIFLKIIHIIIVFSLSVYINVREIKDII